MPKNNADVLVGLADYGTTGAIMSGPVLTDIPETFTEALAAIEGLGGVGYVSEDGLALSTEYGTETVKDWNKSSVRTLLNDFTGTMTYTLIQADYDGWCMLVGEENVDKVDADAQHGEMIHVHIGSHLPARRCYAARMKDGDNAMIVLVPNGQVTSGLDVTFQAGDVIRLPIEIDCLDDGAGDSIHYYATDGTVVHGNSEGGE